MVATRTAPVSEQQKYVHALKVNVANAERLVPLVAALRSTISKLGEGMTPIIDGVEMNVQGGALKPALDMIRKGTEGVDVKVATATAQLEAIGFYSEETEEHNFYYGADSERGRYETGGTYAIVPYVSGVSGNNVSKVLGEIKEKVAVIAVATEDGYRILFEANRQPEELAAAMRPVFDRIEDARNSVFETQWKVNGMLSWMRRSLDRILTKERKRLADAEVELAKASAEPVPA